MAEFHITLPKLPAGVASRGPWTFTLQDSGRDGVASVLTIPIVNRGPESFAESADQEQWVGRRWPRLQLVFAGAWTLADRPAFLAIAEELCALAGGPSAAARLALHELQFGAEPPRARAPNGCSQWNPRADVDDTTRNLARAQDLQRWDALVALAPTWHEAWLARARRRTHEHEDCEGGAADAQHACTLAPHCAEVWEELALAHRLAGRLDAAAEALQRATSCADAGHAPTIQLASVLVALGRSAEAVAAADQALKHIGKKHPEYQNVQLLRAQALAAVGRVDQALNACRAAARAQPSSADPWLRAAKLLWQRGERLEEALDLAAKASPLASAWSVEPLVVHAGLLRALGRPGEALPLLDLALERSPGDAAALGERGLVHTALQHWQLALDDLDRYLAVVTWAPAQLARAKCRWFGPRNAAGALADLQAVLAVTPGDSEALQLQATCLAGQEGERQCG
ncbi:MAG: tetratricopeptide repeat protein [Deltaproteobacteria bacterium]|nr:tetratricopeptide repeat protein [Deltaproteobacteria bacterium]